MNWAAIGAIGELAGAVAVVLTLVYLAAQIRENTKSNRTASHQALTEASTQLNMLLSSNAELSRINSVAVQNGLEGLSEDEAARYFSVASQTFVLFETLFLMHDNGGIDDSFYEAKLQSVSDVFESKGLVDMWAVQRKWHEPNFANYIDELIVKQSQQNKA